MSFVSWAFAGLYLVALGLRWSIGRDPRWRITTLLVLSWIFYAWHIPALLILIVFSTLTDYVAARLLAGLPQSMAHRRRLVLGTSLVVNLGLLGWFKYAGFLARAISDASGIGVPVPEVVLPIGISFYTFQSMSYTIDVYRQQVRAETSFLRVACYIAFFPQLVAGPIVRASEFLYQFSRRRRFHARVFAEGAYLIVRGLFLKLVVADNLGVVVDTYWDQAAAEPGGILAFSLLVFFACQLFCDFAGYVDIARGVALQLGFRLPINFNAPYIAMTFSSFWRRWHITLSQWMRDYLYVPLGGSRRGRVRGLINVLIVMLISGLWHGANWTFVAWGGVLGLGLVAERLLRIDGRPTAVLWGWFAVVQVTWILSMSLFRSSDIGQGTDLIEHALTGVFDPSVRPDTAGLLVFGWWLTLPVWVLHVRAALAERRIVALPGTFERCAIAGGMAAMIIMLYTTSQQFIYFQF
ncbi:MAG: MBOAT family O-acyltransferase [Pseudomonadota bacterium]